MSQTLTVQSSEVGQVVHVRGGVYMVTDIEKTVFPHSLEFPLGEQSHLISLTSLMDDALGEALQLLWELEPGARVYDKVELPDLHDIAILCPDESLIKQISSNGKLGQYALCDASERHINHVVLDTIRRFKGLESPCVLLVLDAKSAEQNMLLYTGVSRAQSVLEIFAPPQVQFSQ